MLSVVIPLYNKVRHIQRAIDSVLAQTYQDYELIVIDDGSTDGGAQLVRQMSDPRIRLVTQQNAGECAARNRGLHEARFEWVAQLDADDAWLPAFLSTAVAIHERFPEAAICATGFRHLGNGPPKRNAFHLAYDENDSQSFLLDYFGSGDSWMALCACSLLLRKEAVLAVGGFRPGVIRAGDVDTWVRIALRYPIAWTPRCLVNVHDDADNRTACYAYTGNWPFFQSVREYLKEAGPEVELPPPVYRWLAHQHTGLLKDNWLAGRRGKIQEIVRDCVSIPGFRCKCVSWYLLSWCPLFLTTLAWRCRSILAGRWGQITPELFRGIRPEDRV